MTVFLCGFMGCGKSTIGKILAGLMDLPFIDMDDYIVEQQGMSIPEIFKTFGESEFRVMERHAIDALSRDNYVIACGGGAMLKPENADTAKRFGGNVIFLDVPFEVCYNRIKGDKNRPLITDNPIENVEKLYNARRPFYKKNATFSLNANTLPFETAENIYRILKG